MKKIVQKFMIQSDFELGEAQIQSAITTFLPFSLGLSAEERKGLRSKGTGRDGYARLVSRTANVHGQYLPRTEDPKELADSLDYFDAMAEKRVKAYYLVEVIDDTTLGVAADIMGITDRYVGYLQTARTGDANLDEAMKEIDEYNSRFGVRTGKEETPPATPVV
jgi:hypothetical protein